MVSYLAYYNWMLIPRGENAINMCNSASPFTIVVHIFTNLVAPSNFKCSQRGLWRRISKERKKCIKVVLHCQIDVHIIFSI